MAQPFRIAPARAARDAGRPGPGDCVSMPDAPNTLPNTICSEEIEKIATSVTFARAEQLRELLRWLGARSLAEAIVSPSETEIARQSSGGPISIRVPTHLCARR